MNAVNKPKYTCGSGLLISTHPPARGRAEYSNIRCWLLPNIRSPKNGIRDSPSWRYRVLSCILSMFSIDSFCYIVVLYSLLFSDCPKVSWRWKAPGIIAFDINTRWTLYIQTNSFIFAHKLSPTFLNLKKMNYRLVFHSFAAVCF